MTVQQWEQMWLPLWPLASDDFLQGVYRTSRANALGKRFIEANPPAMSNLLVVDVDHPDAALRAMSSIGNHPMPNVIVTNPRNGHAHAVWALTEPITRTEYARRKPLAYAAAVTEGLRRALDGDQGYSGLMTKNPGHTAWDADVMHTGTYDLAQLEYELGGHMPPAAWKQTRRTNPVGLGRNCSLFESARTWAYAEARRIRLRHEHATAEDKQRLLERLVDVGGQMNAEFAEPLPASELRAIVTSIHRWTTTRFYGWTDSRTVNQATFTTIQSARRARRTVKQIEARTELFESLKEARP